MPGQTFTLAEYPFNWIELACEKCGWHGKLRKARLMEQYGPDIQVADLREKLAEPCEHLGSMPPTPHFADEINSDACFVPQRTMADH